MRTFAQKPNPTQQTSFAVLPTPQLTLHGRVFPFRSDHSHTTSIIQTKLSISTPGDESEQEADRFAEQVMRQPKPQLQRTCTEGESGSKCQDEKPEDKDEQLQPKRVGSNASSNTPVPGSVNAVLASPGQPLDSAARAFMEPRFGHDFSRVRVHTDAMAAQSARDVNALAYTVGQNLVFDRGQYEPGTEAGKRLLAHELTHVIQQGSSLALQRYTVPSNLPCTSVVSWMKNNSPHKPEWAATKCNYQFPPNIPYSWKPLKNGTVEVTVTADDTRAITVDCPIDRPEWTPDERPNQAAEAAAFALMRTALDAHEAAHQKIGQTWKDTLEARYKALAFTLIVPTKDDAAAAVSAKGKEKAADWMAEAQKAQDAIDPAKGIVLACP